MLKTRNKTRERYLTYLTVKMGNTSTLEHISKALNMLSIPSKSKQLQVGYFGNCKLNCYQLIT